MRMLPMIALLAALTSVAAVSAGRGYQRIAPAAIPLAQSQAALAPVSPAAVLFEPGRWELRPRDGGAAQQICLISVDRLLKLRHEAVGGCEQFALRAPPGQTTVQYTCRGRGYGRTHLRFETARLLQFDTQGVLDGIPFEMTAEARRIGDCTN